MKHSVHITFNVASADLLENCVKISNCTIKGDYSATIDGYDASFSHEEHEYLLYNLKKTGTGPYLFSVHEVGNRIAQSLISAASVTELNCTLQPYSMCHCVDPKDVSNNLKEEQNSSDYAHWEHESTPFISTEVAETEYQPGNTEHVGTITSSTLISSPATSISPSIYIMNSHGLPIFVYPIIALVAGFVLMSSLCTCLIGCQMYKRRNFQPDVRFVAVITNPAVESELHPMTASHPPGATQSLALVSTDTISGSVRNRESNVDFNEVSYAMSDDSNPPLQPRSWQTPKRDFNNVMLREGEIQKDKPLYSMICNSESGSLDRCSSLTEQKSVREEKAYEEPYTTCSCDERLLCSEKSDILAENEEIRQENIQNAQKEDNQESITPNYLPDMSEAIQALADTSTVKTTLTGGNHHSYELTVPVFVNHTPLLSPPPCTPSDYDRLHRNHLGDFGHDGRASEAMQHTSFGELGARIFTFPLDLEPDVQIASPHVYNTLEKSTADEAR